MTRIDSTGTTLIVQHIHITWTKVSRGGRLAQRRNQISNAFPLPQPPPARFDKQEHYIVDRIEFGEGNEFAEPIRREVSPGLEIPFRARNCRVEIKAGIPEVTFEWTDGAPRRDYIDKSGTQVPVRKTFSLSEGRWGRVEYNARFSCRDFGMWSYEHEIINVAFADPDDSNLFLNTQPEFECRQLESLW